MNFEKIYFLWCIPSYSKQNSFCYKHSAFRKCISYARCNYSPKKPPDWTVYSANHLDSQMWKIVRFFWILSNVYFQWINYFIQKLHRTIKGNIEKQKQQLLTSILVIDAAFIMSTHFFFLISWINSSTFLGVLIARNYK